MQKPSERHKLTSDNNIIQFKKPVHDPFKEILLKGLPLQAHTFIQMPLVVLSVPP